MIMRARNRPERAGKHPCVAARLAADQKGATLVEFALILPILAALTLGTIDFAQGFAEKFRLEQAAQRTIEMALARSVVESDYKYLEAEAAAAANVPVSQAKVTTWLECERGAPAAFDGECAEDQMVARYVRIRIEGFYKPQFQWGPLGRIVGVSNNGTVPLTVAAAVRVQ
jgi:Flp pilus assembly protein TadG